jgi:hypothetical protein
MKTIGKTMMKVRPVIIAMPGKHELMIRRDTNHNAHIITHHGKVMVGRKGRTN